jgi:hypothetical protein
MLIAVHLNADLDLAFTLIWMWIRIWLLKIMRIHGDPDPQHCFNFNKLGGWPDAAVRVQFA